MNTRSDAMRNHLLDNAKAAFMVMVVLGHLIEPLRGVHATHPALYIYLYAIHVPGLVLLSGAVAHRELTFSELARNARSLLVPFVAFELLYEGLYLFMHGKVSSYAQGFEPYWLLWYLPSLFLWRVMFPIVCLLRAPLLISILAALSASCSEETGYFLGISRTLVLFPFFVVGALWRSALTKAAPSHFSEQSPVLC